MEDLIEKANNWKKTADDLLRKSNLISTLNEYGSVAVVGSYKYNLMTKGDIDIYVLNDNSSKELAINALNKLIEMEKFRGYFFYDWVKYRKEEFPIGYYVGLKTKIDNEKWKIDIWFLEKPVPELVGMDKLDNNKRNIILKIKSERDARNLLISSYEIYDSVINRGFENIEDFE